MAMRDENGKVKVRFFLWPSIIISVVLSIVLTLFLNLIF